MLVFSLVFGGVLAIKDYFKKKFDDTKGVIRSHFKSMKDRLDNGHTKKEQNGQEMIYKHYTET
jgi:hypothetical protein